MGKNVEAVPYEEIKRDLDTALDHYLAQFSHSCGGVPVPFVTTLAIRCSGCTYFIAWTEPIGLAIRDSEFRSCVL